MAGELQQIIFYHKAGRQRLPLPLRAAMSQTFHICWAYPV
jgi:hypothetical protein